MKYCARCRRTIRLAVKVCPFCGGELELSAMDERPALTPIPRDIYEEGGTRRIRGVDGGDRPTPSTISQSLDEVAVRHIMDLDAEDEEPQERSERESRRPSLWSEEEEGFGEDSFASFVSELVSEDGPKRTESPSVREPEGEPSRQLESTLPRKERTPTDAIEALVRLAAEARKVEPRDTDVDQLRRRERRSTIAPMSQDDPYEEQREVAITGDVGERRQRVSRTARNRVSALDSAIFAPKLQDSATRAVYAAGWRAGLMKATEALREVLEKDELRAADLLDVWDRLYTLAYGYDVEKKEED